MKKLNKFQREIYKNLKKLNSNQKKSKLTNKMITMKRDKKISINNRMNKQVI